MDRSSRDSQIRTAAVLVKGSEAFASGSINRNKWDELDAQDEEQVSRKRPQEIFRNSNKLSKSQRSYAETGLKENKYVGHSDTYTEVDGSSPQIDEQIPSSDTAARTTTAPTKLDKNAKKQSEDVIEAELSKRRRVSFGSTVSTTTTTSGSLYSYHGSETSSESDMYVYHFLGGSGREDSILETSWTYNGVDISKDLMTFRDRIVRENYGISRPHEMLVINFIFLLESENQIWGLQGEVQDHVWESMWDCEGKKKINNFKSTIIIECHKWAALAASNNFDEYSKLLKSNPPSFPLLHQVLLQLISSQQLWTFSGLENEATFIRYLIDPCLNVTFGSIKHTSSKWTTVLDETRGQDSRLLFPDFSLVTQLRDHSCSLIWDDLTKLGQELKLSLDTMIVLEPSGPVSDGAHVPLC
ncbi:hypothetical protein BCR41DRAFT_349918 [Lobosporangium transversale]|uniref:Uncharacterized protein n=1 Tax=Lobosporangium transversale TaxID=64571 RepID=A0A1Y2GSE4_9FUNG|nr:hypothetical protein BCR41DRAFT_349918 [Lobosporangium transversale]ORZ21715.1 hypothetical protein BCR41DRAFT_349918 [Lobosporangium transversale]|eukprot:XP_021882966.1 hypothetical protein BCR41DRAFT_349918 [Lobosporangium transversale]